MPHRLKKYIIMLAVCLAGTTVACHAQFKEKAFTQTYNEKTDSTAVTDTADKLFSFKEYFGGLSHKNTMKIGTMFAGSVFLPGTAQIYNKDYWKLPIVYGGIGAFAGTGGYYMHRYTKSKKAYENFMSEKSAFETETGNPYPHAAPEIDYRSRTTGAWLLAGAGLMYWGSLMDGIVCYESNKNPHPGRATLYSALLPGLGQIYNGELYKVPIYWGGLMVSVHCLTLYDTNYKRFKRIHNEATNPDGNYTGPVSGETAKWYRDVYRRYRDYSIVATALVYLLQVIDANVFAYMHGFEVSDDITMNIEPAVIAPDNTYAMNSGAGAFGPEQNALGLRVGIRF